MIISQRILFTVFAVCCAFLAYPASGQDAADPEPTGLGKRVHVLPVQKMIEPGLAIIIVRDIKKAEADDASLIILDMDTPGGSVESAMRIRDELIRTSVPTLTFINNNAISAGALISLATDTIVMTPGSNIGAATPFFQTGTGEVAVDAKMISAFASEMRATAKANGHPPEIAAAMVDSAITIPGVVAEGEILTLDYDDATSVGLAAYLASDIDDVLDQEGLSGASVVRHAPTWTDNVARFLSHPAVAGMLMLIGLGGVIFEVKSPGFGIPGIVGIVALSLHFFGASLAHLSSYVEIIFFVLGVLLLAVEIYVIPGFGVAGIAGILLIIGSLFFSLITLAPDGFSLSSAQLEPAILTMSASIIGLVPVVYLGSKILPHTQVYSNMMLTAPASKSTAGPSPSETEPAPKPGDVGTTVTDLRPSGRVEFAGGHRMDAVTEGEFVPKGEKIQVVRIQWSEAVVRSVADDA